MPSTKTSSALTEADSDATGLDGGDSTTTSTSSARRPRPRRRRRSVRLPLIAGSLLLVTGLAVVGYAFFQLVVTDVMAARAQDQLQEQFTLRLASSEAIATRDQFVAELRSRRGETEASDDPTMLPRADDASDGGDGDAFDDETDVPVMMGSTAELEPALPSASTPWVYEAAPARGDPLGRIVIPAIDVDWLVVEGVRVEDLRKGPGHMPTTALPGQFGNSVISGHRTTYGAPFFDLDALEAGDEIVVETLIGSHTYEVVETRIVAPTDMWVTSQWEGAWLTLTTCNPRYSAQERLIVFAKLVDGPNAESTAVQFGSTYVVPEPPSS